MHNMLLSLKLAFIFSCLAFAEDNCACDKEDGLGTPLALSIVFASIVLLIISIMRLLLRMGKLPCARKDSTRSTVAATYETPVRPTKHQYMAVDISTKEREGNEPTEDAYDMPSMEELPDIENREDNKAADTRTTLMTFTQSTNQHIDLSTEQEQQAGSSGDTYEIPMRQVGSAGTEQRECTDTAELAVNTHETRIPHVLDSHEYVEIVG